MGDFVLTWKILILYFNYLINIDDRKCSHGGGCDYMCISLDFAIHGKHRTCICGKDSKLMNDGTSCESWLFKTILLFMISIHLCLNVWFVIFIVHVIF